jgi:hypothetical protein
MIDPATEQQYNNRANVPEHPALLAEWAAKSAAWEAEARAMRTLAYGDSDAETLDLFLADAEGAPVHMFIHGGYWQALSKKDCSFVARPLVAAGLHVAVVDYGLCPDVTIDEIGRQCRAALAFLYRGAREFGGDPDNITVSGHSCGGHLVGMARSAPVCRPTSSRAGSRSAACSISLPSSIPRSTTGSAWTRRSPGATARCSWNRPAARRSPSTGVVTRPRRFDGNRRSWPKPGARKALRRLRRQCPAPTISRS